MKNTNNIYKHKNYWGKEYFEYWRARTAEAELEGEISSLIETDAKTPKSSSYEELISLLNICENERVLEAGCGFGRSIRYLAERCLSLTCVDISDEMITQAKIDYGSLENVNFHVAAVEETKLEDRSVDKIVCYGVFEAVLQEMALREFERIIELNGKLLLTGKNYNYTYNDEEAWTAELNARQKGHPNYFTYYSEMLDLLANLGFIVTEERFFVTRKNMAENVYVTTRPAEFYYYAAIFQKTQSYIIKTDITISSSHSKRYSENDEKK
ncbi:class I SAM-dependent methyltransferase [Betaproteobacteria bacterium LSUCC0117]|nr:class I SAM-dependent methyltransferase [Betaproteobacteria bacterium LSUCC0117]